MRLLRWTRRVSELCQLLAMGRCMGERFETSFSQKENQNQSWRCDSDQARHPRLIFDGAAFKKLEGLCVGILIQNALTVEYGLNSTYKRAHMPKIISSSVKVL